MIAFTICLPIVVGLNVIAAHLGRTLVLVVLTYLALRRTEPADRHAVLTALRPVMTAVGPAVGSWPNKQPPMVSANRCG